MHEKDWKELYAPLSQVKMSDVARARISRALQREAETTVSGGSAQTARTKPTRKQRAKNALWLAGTVAVAASLVAFSIFGPGRNTLVPPIDPAAQGTGRYQAVTEPFRSVHMVDAQAGWAAAQNGAVLRTEDGGQTWYDVTPKALPSAGPDTSVSTPFFLQGDGRVAWLLDFRTDTVYRTRDAGQHWQQGTAPKLAGANDGGAFLSFATEQNGWLLVGSGGHNQSGQLFQTTDGGMTWTAVAKTAANGSGLPFGGQIVFSPSVNGLGWLRPDRAVGAKGTPPLYVTHDGGKTWEPQQLSFPAAFQNYSSDQVYVGLPQFVGKHAVMPVTVMSGKANSAVFYSTEDGGKTWNLAGSIGGVGSNLQFLTSVVDVRTFWSYLTEGNALWFTGDGGQNWSLAHPRLALKGAAPSPGNLQLIQIDFISAAEGWAVDMDGVLLHTTDGGQTWLAAGQAAAVTASDLSQVSFSDANNGWAITGSGAGSRVLRSSDGGSTWTDVTPSGAPASPATMRWTGYFLDDRTAWVALSGEPTPPGQQNTTIYRTTDGGKTWQSATAPGTGFAQMGFNNETSGWLMLHQGAAAGSEGVVVFTTKDGGASWQLFTDSGVNSGTFGGDKSGFGFADAQHAWITGVWAADSVLLYHTTNGGKTWSQQALPVPSGLSAEGGGATSFPPVFASPQNGTLPVVFSSGNGAGKALVLYTTHDGGQTWVATTPLQASNNIYSQSFDVLDYLHVVVADAGHIYTTSDAGQHWQTVAANHSLAEPVQISFAWTAPNAPRPSFATPTNGWVIQHSADGNSTTLLHSTDGGRTWTELTPAAVSAGAGNIPAVGGAVAAPPGTVTMLDPQNGYGWTADHPVAVTHDGGRTWSDATPKDPGIDPKTAVDKGYFVDAQTGWAFALRPSQSMTVYATQDGGQSWTKFATVPVKYGDGNMSVTFADAQHGWFEEMTAGMGQLSGELFATSDGGKTWTKVADSQKGSGATASPGGNLPFGGQITAQPGGALWLNGGQRAAGSQGGPGFIWFFKSTDGGKTWTQVSMPIPAGDEQGFTSVSQPVFFGKTALVTVLYNQGDSHSVLYASSDMGKTWTVQSTALPAGNGPVFGNPMVGYQTDGQRIYRTQDFGKTWQPLAPDATLKQALTNRFIGQIDFVDYQNGWAVLDGRGASNPVLLATSDGGQTWSNLSQ